MNKIQAGFSGHIKWRPSRRHHIASSALVMDCNVNVWDIRRPYIPFASFDHHKDVATGVVWRGSPHVFLTTSRDGQLIQNVFSDCKRPADSANPQVLKLLLMSCMVQKESLAVTARLTAVIWAGTALTNREEKYRL